MALTREEKQLQINDIKDKFSKATSVILVEYKGITVQDDTQLRAQCRENALDYKVYKNRLVKIALQDLEIQGYDEHLKGSTAIVFSYDDVIAPSKILVDQAKKIKVLKVKTGMVEGKMVSLDEIKVIASIPSKETLIAQILGLLQGSISSLARALSLVAEKKN